MVTARRQAATSILIQHRMMRCLRIVCPPGSSAPHTQKGLRFSSCRTDKPPFTSASAHHWRASIAFGGPAWFLFPNLRASPRDQRIPDRRCRQPLVSGRDRRRQPVIQQGWSGDHPRLHAGRANHQFMTFQPRVESGMKKPREGAGR